MSHVFGDQVKEGWYVWEDFRIRCKLQRISPENSDKIERRKDWAERETLKDVVCRKVNVGGSVSESRV